MNDSSDEAKDVFDVERVKRLIALMHENDLSEIDLRHAEHRIRLRRGSDHSPQFITAPAAANPVPAPVASAADSDSAPAKDDDPNIKLITSPMVGTFYSRPNPKAAPYVKVGDHVDPETTVCTVEAMKMFNEIPAGVSGKIVAILVENEEPVDVNKPLYKVDSSQ